MIDGEDDGNRDDAEEETTESPTLDGLRCRRLLVEAYALVAEALLTCPNGEDVVAHHPPLTTLTTAAAQWCWPRPRIGSTSRGVITNWHGRDWRTFSVGTLGWRRRLLFDLDGIDSGGTR